MDKKKEEKTWLAILCGLIVLAISVVIFMILMSGCSSREELFEEVFPPGGKRPIEFVNGISRGLYGNELTRGLVFTDKAMKSAMSGGLGVLAYSTQTSAWDEAKTTAFPDLMYNQKVLWNKEQWNYQPVKYWLEDDKVTFFAYAPYESQPATGANKGIKLSPANIAGAPALEFTLKEDAKEMVDLVVSGASNDRTSADGTVDLYLEHVLSRVRFTARSEAAGNKTKIFVTDLKLLGKDSNPASTLNQKASFRFAAQPDTPWQYDAPNSSQMNNYELGGILNKSTPTDAYGYSTESVEILPKGGSSLFVADHYLFLIPVIAVPLKSKIVL